VKLLFSTALIFSSTFLIAQPQNIEEVGKSPVEMKFAAGGQIRMDLCSTGIDILGRDDEHLRVSYNSAQGQDVKIRMHVFADHADLSVHHCPHNNFHVTIEIPKSSNLYARMPAGEMNIHDIAGNKDVEVHAGQLNVDVGKAADYAHVDASVWTGEVDAPPFNVDKGGLFRSFEQTGPGKYRLHVHVGAGEIDLR
jgi:hypothetical protein